MLPPVFKVDHLDGANARHNLFCIRIRKDLEHFDAILAQEKFEWWYLRKWNAMTIGPILALAFFIGGDAGIMLGTFGFIAAYFGVYKNGYIKRRMELIGHMVETIIAAEQDGADFDTYLRAEAKVLTRYGQFNGWSVDEVEAALREVEPIARRHV